MNPLLSKPIGETPALSFGSTFNPHAQVYALFFFNAEWGCSINVKNYGKMDPGNTVQLSGFLNEAFYDPERLHQSSELRFILPTKSGRLGFFQIEEFAFEPRHKDFDPPDMIESSATFFGSIHPFDIVARENKSADKLKEEITSHKIWIMPAIELSATYFKGEEWLHQYLARKQCKTRETGITTIGCALK
jgi:hypothetical protein